MIYVLFIIWILGPEYYFHILEFRIFVFVLCMFEIFVQLLYN